MYTPEEANAILAKLPPNVLEEYRKLAPHILLYQGDKQSATPEPTPAPTPAPTQQETTLEEQLAAIKEQLAALTKAPEQSESKVTVPGTPPIAPTPQNGVLPQSIADVDALLKQYPLVTL